MITTRDPETMTADERCQEVASILATGLLRRIRQHNPEAGQTSPPGPQIELDLPSERRLSVAQQPVG